MNLQVTKKFYKKIRSFFFPENNETRNYPASVASNPAAGVTRTNSDDSTSDIKSTTGTTLSNKIIAKIRQNPSSAVSFNHVEPLEQNALVNEQAKLMAERAQNNHSFVYIKIPQGKCSVPQTKFHCHLNLKYLGEITPPPFLNCRVEDVEFC